jgi:branched-subunit amino acid aminotransferase/4-amino-4-deoxychorismate lyase
MASPVAQTVEVNGRPATPDDLRAIALAGYGHFTAMQVRDGGVRGLEFHLKRLEQASAELFGAGLDRGAVRSWIRQALGSRATAASVRVYIQQPESDAPPTTMVTVRPPASPPAAPVRLLPVSYQRCVAHLKHSGDFGQSYYGRLAAQHGFDDALLTGPDGLISETAIANVGFFDGTSVIWPAAAMLQGVTMQLVQQRLMVPHRFRPVRLADLDAFAAVFVTNSHGVAAVEGVDERVLHVDDDFSKLVADSYESAPLDLI